ncbi:MAG TPA: hypothetical protein VOB72_16785 [Candidatus Dormibacteraeota bacterium]|nr:hypothetical protein [Candidatus Dormibacteraeota bacterium]
MLADVERDVTTAALFRIRRQPIPGRYDAGHLRAFHRAIFADVYPLGRPVPHRLHGQDGPVRAAAAHRAVPR